MRWWLFVTLFAACAAAQQPAQPRAPSYEQGHKDLIAACASLVFCIGHLLFCCGLYLFAQQPHHTFLVMIGGVCALIGAVMFCIVFFGIMWQDYVKMHFWPRPLFTVVNTTTALNVCVAVVCDKGCIDGSSRTSCDILKDAGIPGPCDGGHHCCNNRCHDSVDHLWCTVLNGTCATIRSRVTFWQDDVLYWTTYTQTCGLGDSYCVTQKQGEYVAGKTFRAYQNPEAPDDLHRDVQYSQFGMFVYSMAFVGVGYTLILWVIITLVVRCCCRHKKSVVLFEMTKV
jgi:hypothetical protein